MKIGKPLIFLSLGIVGLAAASGWLYSRQSLFRLADIQVNSEDRELAEQVQRQLMDQLGKSLFTVSLRQIEHDVSKLPSVKKVALRRKWPSTLSISLELKEPVAMMFKQGRLWGVDASGNFVDVLRKPRSLPLMKSAPSDLEIKRELFSWLNRARGWEPKGLDFARIDEISWNSDRGVILKAFDPELEIEVGFRDFDAAWERADQAVSALRSRGIRASSLDATYRHRVVASRLQNFQNELNLKGLAHRTGGAVPIVVDTASSPLRTR